MANETSKVDGNKQLTTQGLSILNGEIRDLRLADDGTLLISPTSEPVVLSAGNSSTTPLAANATFTGTYENILNYKQQCINLFIRPNIPVSGDASDAKGSLYIEYDDTGSTPALTSIPYVVRNPGLFIPQVPITVRAFFRVRYLNDGGASAITALGLTETPGTPTNQTQFSLTTLYYPLATKELLRTLDQSLSGSDPATVTRAVIAGVNPAGQYVHAPATGIITNNPTPTALSPNAVYTSSWYPCLGWTGGTITVDTDAISAVAGVVIQFSNDAATVRDNVSFSLTADSLSHDSFFEPFALRTNFFRLVYTNGVNAQSRFFVSLQLGQFSSQPQNPLPVTEASGVIGGQAGTSGTVNVPAGAVVTGIAAQAGTTAASVTIPGITGTIPVPGSNQQSTQFNMQPVPGSMIGPLAITFSSTAAFVVEWMT